MADKEISKEKLEKDKLNLEIEKLNKSWWQKSEYLSIATTFFIAIVTLGVALWTGLFDAKRERLEIDISKFKSERKSIQDTIQSLETERDSLSKTTEYFSIQKDLLIASLNQGRDSIKIVQSQLEQLGNNLQDVERKNKVARLELNQLNDSIDKLIGPIEDILNAGYESYVSIHWRTQMAGDDSFKIYVIDENWNPLPGVFIDISDLSEEVTVPDSTNSKGECGFRTKDATSLRYVNFSTNYPITSEMPMLVGPSLRYRVMLKARVSGVE